ncbi:MAG: HEAT repeat domain-containing protein [Myxococcales bacterium]
MDRILDGRQLRAIRSTLLRNYSKILAFLALLACVGCKKGSKPEPWYIGEIRLSETTLKNNPALELDVEGLRQALLEAFVESQRFVALAEGKQPPGGREPLLCKLEVAFTREALGDEDGTIVKAEVGVAMELWKAGQFERWKATGMGRSTFNSTDPTERVPAFRRALAQALSQVIEGEEIQLASLTKSDEQLIADLASPDPRVRDFAVRAIAERRSAQAVPALIERLSDPDREVALRAVGALGSIGDPRAVPALIEMTRNRDTQFLLTLVEVVASIGGPDAEGYLFTLSSGHPNESVRRAAEAAQKRMRERAVVDSPDKIPTFEEKTEE